MRISKIQRGYLTFSESSIPLGYGFLPLVMILLMKLSQVNGTSDDVDNEVDVNDEIDEVEEDDDVEDDEVEEDMEEDNFG